MKSITVHGLDEETAKLIAKRAKSEGRSVNKVVKELIGKSLGLGGGKKDNRDEFMDLCGLWTDKEAQEFLESIDDLEVIEEENGQ